MDKKTAQAAAMVAAVLVVVVVAAFLVNRGGPNPAPRPDDVPEAGGRRDAPGGPIGPPDPSAHLALGNPSGAADDESHRDDYLMRKPYFALSYNASTGNPNWVSWCLRADDPGAAPRAQFYPDATLPSGFRRVTPRDYTGSGFDRGHQCPRSDRGSTPEAANATFVMTNIVPQSPHLNQKAWNDLEDYCRTLVRSKRQTLYVVSGPAGRGGEGSNGRVEAIANGKVAVPAKCWKVVVAVDGGTGTADDAARVTADTRVIAVVMPNDQSVGHGWAKYRTSVAEVEGLTGYRFFDRVPAAVAGPLKQTVDDLHIPAAKAARGDD